MSLELRDCWSA